MNWSTIGINFKKANLEQRQKYALDNERVISVYEAFRKAGIVNALIISTCNRTEFFLPTQELSQAFLVLKEWVYGHEIDENLFHIKDIEEATEYFFNICSGLESQIPGDFEIIGQVKKAFKLAKQEGMLNGVWEKAINCGLRAAKRARTETGFYSGASSTSYACLEYLKSQQVNLRDSKFLIIGTGKIGVHTIDHLLKQTSPNNISIANRTASKALQISETKSVNQIEFCDLENEIEKFDIIICSTNAPEYIVTSDMLNGARSKYLIDLSVPLNIDPKIGSLERVELVNIDELSKIVNRNMKKRRAEIEQVKGIIQEELKELYAWNTISTGMPLLSDLRGELEQLKVETLSKMSNEDRNVSSSFLDEYTDELFNQLSHQWIKKVRNKAVDAKA